MVRENNGGEESEGGEELQEGETNGEYHVQETWVRSVVAFICTLDLQCNVYALCSAIVAVQCVVLCAIGLEHEGLYTFAKCFLYL